MQRCKPELAGCGLLRGWGRVCGCWRGSWGCGHGTLVTELLLALEIFVEAHGQILDDYVLHTQAALELGDQLVVRGADLLIDVDALAMLGYAISELSRAPVLGLFNFAALFGAGVLDGGEHFLDFVFRRGGADDEDQIVQTLFHVMTSSFCSRALARENCFRRRLAALAGLKPSHYNCKGLPLKSCFQRALGRCAGLKTAATFLLRLRRPLACGD